MAKNAGNESDANAANAAKEAHEQRTALADDKGLAHGEVVDARLDNRSGAERPAKVDFPAAPQQIDGPDLAHQAEYTRRYLEKQKSGVKSGSLLGQHSPGPHGLSDYEDRKGHDRAGESGGKAAKDGESGSPDPAQPVSQQH